MSTKPNHRRGEGRKQDNGSRWEGEPNDGGAGVRKARRKWRRLRARAERRTGKTGGKFDGSPRVRPVEEQFSAGLPPRRRARMTEMSAKFCAMGRHVYVDVAKVKKANEALK